MNLPVPELLAPAGGPISLKAAVQNGANAVYLGLSSFSARASAENFTLDTLKTWIDYAHLRGVRVHVAINTTIYENELDRAVKMALEADNIGADAFIIQDLGLASKLAGRVRAALHASTQLTVYNTEGCEFLKGLGFSRAVLARELPLEEIKEISTANILDTEVFCHGALCMSYSGQCMLSYAVCGRSGNRGTCSQPCRLKYGIGGGKQSYRLSPMDLCSIEYTDKLVQTGVTSLKIEGRLKSPEYVASVCRSYRHALDFYASNGAKDPEALREEDEMAVVFSRGGFSSGHQLGKLPLSKITADVPGKSGPVAGNAVSGFEKVKGPVAIYRFTAKLVHSLAKGDGIIFPAENRSEQPGGIVNVLKVKGKEVPAAVSGDTCEITFAGDAPRIGGEFRITYSKELNHGLTDSFKEGAENRKVPVSVSLTANIGEKALLTLTDDLGNTVSAESETFAEKSERKTDTEILGEKLCAFGGTCYAAEKFEYIGGENVFINPGELKAMRRQAAEKLSEERIKTFREKAADFDRKKAAAMRIAAKKTEGAENT